MKKNFHQVIKTKKLGVSFDEDLKKRLKDPDFRNAWDEPTGDIYIDTALEITKARSEKKISQSELAKIVGTSQQAIARLESPSYRGRNLSTLQKVAEALGKTLVVRFV